VSAHKAQTAIIKMLTPLISKRLLYGETSNAETPIPAKTKLFCFSSKSVLSSPMEINTTGIIRINYSQKMTRLSSNSCLISSSLGVSSGLFFKANIEWADSITNNVLYVDTVLNGQVNLVLENLLSRKKKLIIER
jgi:hypothetical protein